MEKTVLDTFYQNERVFAGFFLFFVVVVLLVCRARLAIANALEKQGTVESSSS